MPKLPRKARLARTVTGESQMARAMRLGAPGHATKATGNAKPAKKADASEKKHTERKAPGIRPDEAAAEEGEELERLDVAGRIARHQQAPLGRGSRGLLADPPCNYFSGDLS